MRAYFFVSKALWMPPAIAVWSATNASLARRDIIGATREALVEGRGKMYCTRRDTWARWDPTSQIPRRYPRRPFSGENVSMAQAIKPRPRRTAQHPVGGRDFHVLQSRLRRVERALADQEQCMAALRGEVEDIRAQLGAGRDNLVAGVTTAATLWLLTVIGLCFGGGQVGLGWAGAFVGVLVLWGLKLIEERMGTTVRVPSWSQGPAADLMRTKSARCFKMAASVSHPAPLHPRKVCSTTS
jgi:hypothetical protein